METKVPNRDTSPLWLEGIKATPPVLWALLALIVAFAIGPDLWRLVKSGAVTKIGIGIINLELAQRRLAEVKGLDATRSIGAKKVAGRMYPFGPKGPGAPVPSLFCRNDSRFRA